MDDEQHEYVLLESDSLGDGTPPRVRRLPVDAPDAIVACARWGAAAADDDRVYWPLLIRGHPIGALALELPPGETFDEERRALLDATADQCAQALERARLYALEQVRRVELERSNRMKDDFLGIVSHELRTPLSAILGWARMLKRGVVATHEGREKALDAIERNATLQARLVDDLLDVSRIVSGKLELETSTVDLASIVDAALDSVRPALLGQGARGAALARPRRRHRARRRPSPAAGRLEPADERHQVLVDGGAHRGGRRARRPRGARLGSATRASASRPTCCRTCSSDSSRPTGARPAQHGGLGLGLSIVRHVVEAHGGAVAAFSDGEGLGAEIVVDLPATEMESLPNLRATDSQQILARLEGMRVLLVDDDADTRDFLAAALEAAGASLQAVGDARVALGIVDRWRPDIIVSDIAMPGLDGYAFIRTVRGLPPEAGGRTPAIALTALARPKDRVRALAAGFQTHLPKPVDPSELVLTVANLRPYSEVL